MSEQTNHLLHLFSKLLRNPSVLFALRTDKFSSQMRNRGNRTGAQGLLVELWKKDGLTNAEIAELLDIKPSSVTAQVKQLEEAQMVIRKQDEKDKRVNRVFLTEKGRAAQETRDTFQNDVSENIFGALNEEEQEQLLRLMEKLVAENDPHDEKEFQRMAQFFGGPMMENMMNAHDRHAFGNHMRREMQNWQREMRRSAQEMKKSQNHMRKQARDNAPFGEDWKIFGQQMKENFQQHFDQRNQTGFNAPWENFDNEMDERFKSFSDTTTKEKKNKDSVQDPKEPDNWDDF